MKKSTGRGNAELSRVLSENVWMELIGSSLREWSCLTRSRLATLSREDSAGEAGPLHGHARRLGKLKTKYSQLGGKIA